MADYVSDRPGLQETGGNFGQRICCNNDFFSSQSIGKRDRDTNVVRSLKDRENLQQILERKADSTVRGEMLAMKLRLGLGQEIGKRECPASLFRRSIKNLNLSDFNYTKQVDGQIRLREIKISFC